MAFEHQQDDTGRCIMSEIRLVDFRGDDALRGLKIASEIPADNIGRRRCCLFTNKDAPSLLVAGWHTKTGVTVRAFYKESAS
jgi:hypothetical protein